MRAIAKTIYSNELNFRPVLQTFVRLDRWLGVSAMARREWSARLPAVFCASLGLAFYAWFCGLHPIRVELALLLGLVVALLGMYTDGD